ncbi:MAG: leucine-rich repeat domain-containing protein, partial [Candidatus Heimdallarchaeota archaeon]|nr:leucine-rich repeat domain-containing protein [Candidatus Heimdallarchaeota archaeon]MCK5049086.1 leucine-rich repeat domain-containing protein [Candidatus Heimdallarchaeota archaeon]
MEQNLSKSSHKALIALATELGKDLEEWSKEEVYGLNSEGQWDAPVPPFSVNEAGEVIVINLREQKLSTVPEALHWKNFRTIEAIDLGSNNLTEIDLGLFSNMKNLEKLYLSNNQFTEICLSPLSKLLKL